MPNPGDKIIEYETSGYDFRYFGDFDLATGSSTETHAAIVVHGSGRTAETYYGRLKDAAADSGSTAPCFSIQFLLDTDVAEHTLPANTIWWDSNSDWPIGHNSDNPNPNRIGSMEIMEFVIRRLEATMPNLTSISMIGHSAGGQYFSRFPAANAERNTFIRYMPANPSSHMWWTTSRPGKCSGEYVPTDGGPYNEWKYGLEDLNTYFSNVGEASMRTNYQNSEIKFLIGTGDSDMYSGDMAVERSAMYQGKNRLERTERYFQHVLAEFPGAAHEMIVVPHVGHDGEWMIRDPQVRHYLFGGENVGPYTP